MSARREKRRDRRIKSAQGACSICGFIRRRLVALLHPVTRQVQRHACTVCAQQALLGWPSLRPR